MLVAFVATVLACSSLPAADSEPESAKGFTYSLFDGKTLDGWLIRECQTKVQDGAILLEGGNGMLLTPFSYSDFVLEFEWKALKTDDYDSGVFFRSEMPPPAGRVWPKRYQVNLKKGAEGNVNGLKGAMSQGLVKAGDWNHFKLTVAGNDAALEINGKPAWKGSGLEVASGPICLQSEVPLGGQFLFRKMSITEAGFKSLFNGKDLSGWESPTDKPQTCWQVEDGDLICTGKAGPWLRLKEQVGDFCLRLEYKVAPGGNSGVYVRVPADGNHHGKGAGLEVQLLDDAASQYKNLQPYQYTGSLYGIAPATAHVCKPAGQWNAIEINAKGNKYRVTHNGEVIIDADEAKFPKLEERLLKGYLGLQNHTSQVRFRNLRLGPPQP